MLIITIIINHFFFYCEICEINITLIMRIKNNLKNQICTYFKKKLIYLFDYFTFQVEI